MKSSSFKRRLRLLRSYSMFFLLIAFFNSCCMILFLKITGNISGYEFSREAISPAAKVTFVNVLLLSLLCTVVDAVRQHMMVERPVRRISEAAGKVMQGDFSVRIEKFRALDPDEGYNAVIGYFNRMTEELSNVETLRTDFVANVSHELKTPLAVIQNYGTMLQQPELPEDKRIEYSRVITDASRSLANMISNILKLNKLENQSIYPDARVYNLGEQLCECLLGFEDAWEKKNLEIETDIDEGVYVNADPELLSLVWNNLFSNAIKFTPDGGLVSLTLKAEGDSASVSVRDTGCGFSPEVGQHIFEKFYQGDTSHATKGNGLGLALVKRVIDITGGDIEVESTPGRGSRFTVKLGRVRDGEA